MFEIIGADENVAVMAVVPPEYAFVDPTRNRQRNFAVALAGGGGLKFCNTLFKICAAVVEDASD